MLWSTRTLLVITYVTALRYVHYPVELFVATLNRFTSIALITFFWFIVAKYSDGNFDVAQLVSYFLIISGVSQLMLGGFAGANSVLKRIKTGNLNAYLIRPIHPFFYLYYQQLGFMAPFIVVSLLLVVAGVVLAGATALNPFVIILTLMCAYSVNLSFNILVGSIGFYVVEAGGIKNTISHIVMLSQGFLIPVFLTPQWWQNYVFISPFATSLYLPVRALQGQPIEIWQLLVAVFWACTLLPFGLWVWRRSMRVYEGVGI